MEPPSSAEDRAAFRMRLIVAQVSDAYIEKILRSGTYSWPAFISLPDACFYTCCLISTCLTGVRYSHVVYVNPGLATRENSSFS